MAASSRRCCTTALLVASLWLFTTALAGDVNYRDVVLDRKSSYMSRYFRRLYRRQRHCDEPELADRVRMADFILTGTVRALEADVDRPDSKIARVEVKRVFNEHDQVNVVYADTGLVLWDPDISPLTYTPLTYSPDNSHPFYVV